MRRLGLPVTVLRPTAFMEVMTDRDPYPAVGTWHVWPRIAGWDRQVPWLACEDLGVMAAEVFADPGPVGRAELHPAADVRSLRECRDAYAAAVGRPPRRFPMPIRLFGRFAPGTPALWRFLRTTQFDADPGCAHALRPGALTVEQWLRRRFANAAAARR